MARPPITSANPYTPKSGAAAGITFTSERQYRNVLARKKGYRSWSEQQRAAKVARSPEAVARLRPSERQARSRALDAVALMRREGLSLSRAAKAAGTTPNAVKRHARPTLERAVSGRHRARASDRLYRPMQFLTEQGLITLDVRDSRSASRIAAYWNAVKHYLETGDDRLLRTFRGKGVRVDKLFHPFITDLATLDRLADAGEVAFESLYRLVA